MLTIQDLLARAQKRQDLVIAPTVTTGSAYASGNSVGGLITIDNTPTVKGPIEEEWLSLILQSLVVADFDNQKQPITFYFFNAQPSAIADKVAYAPTKADLQKLIATVIVASADYVSINSQGIANGPNQRNIGQVLKPAAAKATALYVVPVVLGTPTWTNGIQFRFQFSQGL